MNRLRTHNMGSEHGKPMRLESPVREVGLYPVTTVTAAVNICADSLTSYDTTAESRGETEATAVRLERDKRHESHGGSRSCGASQTGPWGTDEEGTLCAIHVCSPPRSALRREPEARRGGSAATRGQDEGPTNPPSGQSEGSRGCVTWVLVPLSPAQSPRVAD